MRSHLNNKKAVGDMSLCEHQQTSVLCDKCAILALVKENAKLRDEIADATSPKGVERAIAVNLGEGWKVQSEYAYCEEEVRRDMRAAIRAALGCEVAQSSLDGDHWVNGYIKTMPHHRTAPKEVES